jgi:hypothetical protein
MLALLINPLIVMFLLWLFARHEAELSYPTIFLVISGLTILVFLIGLYHPLIAFICYVFLLPIVITRFFYVSLPKASIITVLFLAWQLLFHLAFGYITRPPSLFTRHVATHTEHPTGGSTHVEHPQAPQHPATTAGQPPSGGTGSRPTGPESRPDTAPAGNAAAKQPASAPPAPVYHYNFPTKSGLVGRDFTRPLTSQEQSAIARQIANGQPTGTQAAPDGYQYDNGVYHYNFRTKSGLIGRDFTRPLTAEEQSALARQIANDESTKP